MAHQDFERYAVERPMTRKIADAMVRIFDQHAPAQHWRVLDHGCGDGTYFCFLSERYGDGNVFGCDVSERRIARCREAGWQKAVVIHPKRPLPYLEASFDLILSDQVIEHIPWDNTVSCLTELHRVLKPGGRLLVVTPNYPVKRVYDGINAITGRSLRMFRDDPTHVTFYNADRLKALLEGIFASVEIVPTGGILFEILPIVGLSHKLVAVAVKKKQ